MVDPREAKEVVRGAEEEEASDEVVVQSRREEAASMKVACSRQKLHMSKPESRMSLSLRMPVEWARSRNSQRCPRKI